MKVVICGAGFLGSHIARYLLQSGCRVQLSSRNPDRVLKRFGRTLRPSPHLSSVPVDVTKPSTLKTAFEGADVVVSLVGIMYGTPKNLEDVQYRGAENVAKAAQDISAKLVHFSAIGADPESRIPYARTKALGEAAALDNCSKVTIFRPSLVFGPEDDFFNRFSRLAKFLPFLPVFGGGSSRFQPVYVDDIARAVETVCRNDSRIEPLVNRKIVEAGGPDIFTYKEIMQLVLKYSHRRRPIVSLPFPAGMLIGSVSELLPLSLFTITRTQIEQLKFDNVVDSTAPSDTHYPFKNLMEYSGSSSLKSVHEVLPTYLVNM